MLFVSNFVDCTPCRAVVLQLRQCIPPVVDCAKLISFSLAIIWESLLFFIYLFYSELPNRLFTFGVAFCQIAKCDTLCDLSLEPKATLPCTNFLLL